jgi:hypothetical protein
LVSSRTASTSSSEYEESVEESYDEEYESEYESSEEEQAPPKTVILEENVVISQRPSVLNTLLL